MAPVAPQRGQLFVDEEGRRWIVDGVVHIRVAKRGGQFIVNLKGVADNTGELVLSSADFFQLLQRGALRQVYQ
jgi:hypothetical protein